MVMIAKKQEKKIPVEQLQEKHLTGPADESREEAADALQVDQVVPVSDKVPMEKIVFRNQRDPGHQLDFHYSSASVPFAMYHLIDGQTYTLPREVVHNLERCRENIEKYRRNDQGIPVIYVAGYKSHFVCERA